MVETEIITNGNYINSSNGELNDVAKGIEERFNAAVNVIRGLPKNGKFYKTQKTYHTSCTYK